MPVLVPGSSPVLETVQTRKMESNDSERDSSTEYLLDKEEQDSFRWKDSKSRSQWPLWLTLINILILGISVSFSIHRLMEDRFESTISLMKKASFYCTFIYEEEHLSQLYR